MQAMFQSKEYAMLRVTLQICMHTITKLKATARICAERG